MATLHFDKQAYLNLKQLYDEAVLEKRDQFLFQGKDILTAYAKYLLEHLRNQGIDNSGSKI